MHDVPSCVSRVEKGASLPSPPAAAPPNNDSYDGHADRVYEPAVTILHLGTTTVLVRFASFEIGQATSPLVFVSNTTANAVASLGLGCVAATVLGVMAAIQARLGVLWSRVTTKT